MGGKIKIVFLRIIEYLFNYRKPRIYFPYAFIFPPQKKKNLKKNYITQLFSPPKKNLFYLKKIITNLKKQLQTIINL